MGFGIDGVVGSEGCDGGGAVRVGEEGVLTGTGMRGLGSCWWCVKMGNRVLSTPADSESLRAAMPVEALVGLEFDNGGGKGMAGEMEVEDSEGRHRRNVYEHGEGEEDEYDGHDAPAGYSLNDPETGLFRSVVGLS